MSDGEEVACATCRSRWWWLWLNPGVVGILRLPRRQRNAQRPLNDVERRRKDPRIGDLGHWDRTPRVVDARRMAWFFRAIEQADGRWACSHGGAVFDRHDELPDALDHLRDIAATMSPAELFVHHLDGDVRNVGSV